MTNPSVLSVKIPAPPEALSISLDLPIKKTPEYGYHNIFESAESSGEKNGTSA
jgi:hypothetical protein